MSTSSAQAWRSFVSPRPDLRAADPADTERAMAGVVGEGVWTMVAVASNGLARLLTVVMVGRAAGVDTLGVFGTGLSIAQLMVLFLPTALGSAASKFVAQGRASPADGDPGQVFGFLVRRLRLVALVLTLASAGVSVAIAGSFDGADLITAVEVAVLTWVLCWYSVVRGLLFGLGLAKRSAFWDVVTSVLTLVLVAVILGLGQVDHGALLAVAAAYALFAAANVPSGASPGLAQQRRSEIDRFCVAVVLGTLASTGFLQLTMIASRSFGGVEAAGHFAAALNFATPVSLLGTSLSLVLFPELAAALAKDDHARVGTMVDRAFRLLLLVTVPVFVATQYAAGPVLEIILGEGFGEASLILVILVAAVLLTTVGIPCVAALTSGTQRGVQASTALSLTGLTLGVLSWAVLVPTLDVTGVAWGYLLGSGVIAAGHIAWAWRRHRQPWVMPVVTTLVAVLALVVVDARLDDAGLAVQVAASVLVCLVWALVQVPFLRRSRRRVES